ncbi:MAG TPA: glycoside hydrolase family 2 TIM barrel-domain containing protein [Polyangiaceae bacterium]|nr:glycoside hydrolase family 2 TIM barrel-domain containing protein [Polyangiaceae bacterium]
MRRAALGWLMGPVCWVLACSESAGPAGGVTGGNAGASNAGANAAGGANAGTSASGGGSAAGGTAHAAGAGNNAGGGSNAGTGSNAAGSSNSNGGRTSGAGGAPATSGAGGVGGLGGSPAAGGTFTAGGTSSGGSSSSRGGATNSGGAAGQGGSTGGAAGAASKGISIQGTQLIVDGKPYHVRGVCWNPVPKGKTHPQGLDFAGAAATDIPLMQRAGINTVRTYEPLTDVGVLDQLYAAGIRVLDSVYVYGGDSPSVVADRITKIKDHPAILAWLVGNEWNYNGLYVDLPAADAQARLVDAAKRIRAIDPNHPVASVYGELPSKAVIDAMPEISLWGINSYRGIDFGDLFDKWAALSKKPMFLAEYGADSYNAKASKYDPESQATAVRELTQQIADHGSAFHSGAVAVGGAIFEWADEWWKDSSGSPNAQEVGGIAPGGGPYPDQTFNEEWWGVVDIDRKPRPAYDALKGVFDSLTKTP